MAIFPSIMGEKGDSTSSGLEYHPTLSAIIDKALVPRFYRTRTAAITGLGWDWARMGSVVSKRASKILEEMGSKKNARHPRVPIELWNHACKVARRPRKKKLGPTVLLHISSIHGLLDMAERHDAIRTILRENKWIDD